MNSTSPAPPSFARPQRERADQSTERGSVLRASILESALELGLGTNSKVANWIFNPVDEEEEEEAEVNSPSLTYASTATSEESNLSAGLAQRSQPGVGILVNGQDALSVDTSGLPFSKRNALTPEPRGLQFDMGATPSPRTLSPAPSPSFSAQNGKNKLRKARPDGYESDGGYMSETTKAKKEREKREKKEKKERAKAEKKAKKAKDGGEAGATDYESDGGHVSEASTKRKKGKEKKNKSKDGDAAATDYETDKGYSSAFSRSKSRRKAVTSPTAGDAEDSDGGYLSEASKKKRFFRLNSKSKKKQDSLDSQQEPPPVPALPVLPHPIADMFSRSTTPLVSDSRNPTPMPPDDSYASSTLRPSEESFASNDTFDYPDTSTTESEERPGSPQSIGLTKAFRDAESVRSPSVDLLSAFRRGGASPSGRPLSPSRFRPQSPIDGPSSPHSPVTLTPSKSIRARPKISAPNTTTLVPKHVPLPLTLTPPTPTGSSHLGGLPPSPNSDYVLVTPMPMPEARPARPEGEHHSHASLASSMFEPFPQSPSQTLERPRVLAYYDLPPPSPPPSGPLPDVPSDISRSTSPSLSMVALDASHLRFPRSAPADTADPRGLHQYQHQRPLASPIDRERERPNTAAAASAPHPLSRQFGADANVNVNMDVPTIVEPAPAPPAQRERGRVSPFPTAPLLPREQTTGLMRQTSLLTRAAVDRALQKGSAPASASPYGAPGHAWPGSGPDHEHERERVVVPRAPASAQPFAGAGNWPGTGAAAAGSTAAAGRSERGALGLDERWRPRAPQRVRFQDEDGAPGDDDDGESWLDYGSPEEDEDEDGDGSSPPTTNVTSAEPSPDVRAILAGFRAQQEARAGGGSHSLRTGDAASARDTLAGIVAGYADSVYLGVDDPNLNGGDRASVWSEASAEGGGSRASFLDGERSAAIRAKFVERVEAMYGKEIVPPVPKLGAALGGAR